MEVITTTSGHGHDASEHDALEPRKVSLPPWFWLYSSPAVGEASVTMMPPGLGESRRFSWTIDKAKVMLGSTDSGKISPLMELPLRAGQGPAKFKLMLKPQISSEGRRGTSFQKAKGKCFIELKCEEGHDAIGQTRFSIWVGDQPPRGPVQHNFSSDVVARLPISNEIWDLKPLLGKMPSNPMLWNSKSSMSEGCLVLGVEIEVFTGYHTASCA